MSQLRTPSVRQWMLFGLVLFAVVGLSAYHFTGVAVQHFWPRAPFWVQRFAALTALISALLFVRWQMGRYLVRPLEAMAAAARRIAIGDLNFELPKTTVREVAEVGAAFQAMVEGLRESVRRQAELEEQRRFFIGAIAHDLRTPLFALRGYLAGLDQGLAGSPEKAASYITISRQKADQLERLVADLFAYARTEYLGESIRLQPVDLGMIMAAAAGALQSRADAKQVTLNLSGAPAGCLADGDEDLLERAIENLIDNAIRYSRPGGMVEVGWQQENGRVSFAVADAGPGIPERDLLHLFEPLYRGESSRNAKTGGVGLGLSIAKRVLEAHGGDLAASNRTCGGAEFSGWLARATAGAESRG